MPTKLTDEHFEKLVTDGYVIIHNYLPEAQRAEMAAGIRRILKPWHEIKDESPETKSNSYYFPYPEQCLNHAIIDDEGISFSKRWLGTDCIHYRPGLAMVRYPGFNSGETRAHTDNGNNSLLPPTKSDLSYSQLIFWFYLEDVDEDQAPTLMVKNSDGDDLSKAEPFVGQGGSVVIFHNWTWHAASSYTREDGQRYIWKFAYGHADHYWEGVAHYTNVGQNQHFRDFIGSVSAEERTLFRFPPPGHPYYTEQTLKALEEQYPGWNSRGEYLA
jgi:hypothetical protein